METNISRETAVGVLTEAVRFQSLRDMIYHALKEDVLDSNSIQFDHFAKALFNIDIDDFDYKTEERYLSAWQDVILQAGENYERKANQIYDNLQLLKIELDNVKPNKFK